MPSEAAIQKAIHTLEMGKLAPWLRRALFVTVIFALATYYLLHEFNGLATSQAMDQAQIGRAIVEGHGWHTKFIRPLAVGELQRHGKEVTQAVWKDTYNAPLPPLIDAFVLLLVGNAKMTSKDMIYSADHVIALISVLFFICSLGVLYLIAVQLFDQFLARLACGLVMICDMMWRYSLSGLPQMLLLLLFLLTIHALIGAIRAQYLGGCTWLWIAAIGLGFGLLALTHALTIWMFIPVLAFSFLWFKPRGRVALVMLGVFLLTYAPWLIRNYKVCGNPCGLAIYSALDGINHSEAGHMRRFEIEADFSPQMLFHKMRTNLVAQLNRIFEYLGWSFVAPVFFLSLLHSFKRPLTALMRWLLLAMWIGAVLGMAAFGLSEEQGFAANQLHLLFVPLLTCYGLGFLLMQWSHHTGLAFLSTHWPKQTHLLLRNAGLTLLFILCGLPTLFTLRSFSFVSSFHWPPYMPPYISVLHDWMKPQEITATDMPWAVAWYADRRALWLPTTIKEFTNLNDYKTLGAPVNGLYLTPISGTMNTMGDIYSGEYKDWSRIVLHIWDVNTFPLHAATLLGSPECVFLSDHDRRQSSGK